MSTLVAPRPTQQGITAYTAASGYPSNELADYATSLRGVSGFLGQPLPILKSRRFAQIEINGPAPKLVRVAAARVNELLAMPHGWDSYGGRPISASAAMTAISWLDEIVMPGLPSPSVVPGSDGSIQFEWHMRGIDLEVLFPPSGDPEFLYVDHSTGKELEGHVSSSNQYGRGFVHTLATRVAR